MTPNAPTPPAAGHGPARRGGGWVLVQLGLMTAAVVLGCVFHRQPGWPGTVRLGGVIMDLGGVTAIMGFAALGKRITPFPQPRPNSQLEQSGIYGLMRHPLYTSIIVTAFGWALFRQSWPALGATCVLVLFLDAKTREEEIFLRRQFPEYEEYSHRVRRFLPGIY